jgi:hypothetical protein
MVGTGPTMTAVLAGVAAAERGVNLGQGEMAKERIYLFDTTLRDGQQTPPRDRRSVANEDAQTKNRAAAMRDGSDE